MEGLPEPRSRDPKEVVAAFLNVRKVDMTTESAARKLTEVTNQPSVLRPSEPEIQGVAHLVTQLPMKRVSTDFGYVAGKFLSDVLESAGLRPADFVYIDELATKFISRLVSELTNSKEVREAFAASFLEQLMLRG